MANKEHLQMLLKGADVWNQWKKRHPRTHPRLYRAKLSHADLSHADLRRADLSGTNLHDANLHDASLEDANLRRADLSEANLSHARLYNARLFRANLSHANLSHASLSLANLEIVNFSEANLSNAHLGYTNLMSAILNNADLNGAYLVQCELSFVKASHANLSGADLGFACLSHTNLSGADLSGADLSGADLSGAILMYTNLSDANLTSSFIHGISVWDVNLERATQRNLIITPKSKPAIVVDNLEVAQFIYLLLHNPKIRDIIDTVAQKAVLILGRFTSTRKPVLEAIRMALRSKGYVPILFDFEPSESQNTIETVNTLAHLSRFIIADLTDPSCSPFEIGKIAPNHIKPIIPLFQPSVTEPYEFAMLEDLREQYSYILPTYRYRSLENLITSLQDKVITPAERELDKILKRRRTTRAKSKKM